MIKGMDKALRTLGFRGIDELVAEHGRVEVTQKRPCAAPQPWDRSPTTCGRCGREIAAHNKGDEAIPGYSDAVWTWILTHGGIPSYHGGYEDVKSAYVRQHLAGCRVDHKASDLPELGHVSQFSDSISPSDEIDAVVGRLNCACGTVMFTEWAYVGSISLGELLFQVLNP